MVLFALLTCFFSFFSCEEEELKDNNVTSENFWKNASDSEYIQDLLFTLKSLSTVEDFKNETLNLGIPVWDQALNLYSSDGKLVLHVPLVDKNDTKTNAFLLITNSNSKSNFDTIEISYLEREDALKLKETTIIEKDANTWTAFFKAMDKEIFDIQNGSKGFMKNSNDQNYKHGGGSCTACIWITISIPDQPDDVQIVCYSYPC